MSEANKDPTAMDRLETDREIALEQGVQDEIVVDEAAFGEALSEVANEVADEALLEAQQPHSRKQRSNPGRKRSAMKKIDGTLAIVLLSNLLFMGLVLFLPDPQQSGEEVVTPDPRAGQVQDPTPAPRVSDPKSQGPLESRIVQLAEIEKLVRLGRFGDAVTKIEASLQANPDLPPTVRRSLYSRLANYCAEAGQHDKALKYLKLANSGFQMSLLPKDLWKMAGDAVRLGDQPGARKYLARFLLQESLMNEETESKISAAYLRLADGYRIQADEAEKSGGAK